MDSGSRHHHDDETLTATTNLTSDNNPQVNVIIQESSDHPIPSTTARSYDCMFCKRGFSTAQALGGHMNIHRRDRARNRDPNVVSPQLPSSPPVMITTTNVRPEYHEDTRVFFPSESSYIGTSSVKVEKRVGKEEVDQEKKMRELIHYGKQLELGLKKTTVVVEGEGDENHSATHGEEDNVTLKLGF